MTSTRFIQYPQLTEPLVLEKEDFNKYFYNGWVRSMDVLYFISTIKDYSNISSGQSTIKSLNAKSWRVTNNKLVGRKSVTELGNAVIEIKDISRVIPQAGFYSLGYRDVCNKAGEKVATSLVDWWEMFESQGHEKKNASVIQAIFMGRNYKKSYHKVWCASNYFFCEDFPMKSTSPLITSPNLGQYVFDMPAFIFFPARLSLFRIIKLAQKTNFVSFALTREFLVLKDLSIMDSFFNIIGRITEEETIQLKESFYLAYHKKLGKYGVVKII